MSKLLNVYKQTQHTKSNFIFVALSWIYHKLYGVAIVADRKTKIYGKKNIHTSGILKIGFQHADFTTSKDDTYLNVQGILNVNGGFSLGRGARITILPGGRVELGDGSYFNSNAKINIINLLVIGKNTFIAWGCQIIDYDFHALHFEGKKARERSGIYVGDNVWIGCNVSIYKDSYIANGCVVAADAKVRGVFLEENCLIAGNPAKVIKRNITWS